MSNLVKEVSINEPIVYDKGKKRVAVIDCGIKNNIIRSSSSDSNKHGDFQDELIGYWMASDRILWTKKIKVEFNIYGDTINRYPIVFPSEDDRYLIIGNRRDIQILDAYTGKTLKSLDLERPLVDLVTRQRGREILAITDEVWNEGQDSGPKSRVIRYRWTIGTVEKLEIPNCASSLKVSKNEDTIFISPTRCRKDPVSIVNLRTFRFERNLPGFGPVALDSKGERAIAFMDMDNLDRSLFLRDEEIPRREDSRYRLMVIDAQTHRFETYKVGNNLPRYALTPDGNVLLIDHSRSDDQAIKLLDFHLRKIVNVRGPAVKLKNFVMTDDSRFAFLLDRGLYELYIPGRSIESVSMGFVPQSINITPRTQNLILGTNNNTEIRIWDPMAKRTIHTFRIPRIGDGIQDTPSTEGNEWPVF